MKLASHSTTLLLLVLLVLSLKLHAHLLETNQGKEEEKTNEIASGESAIEIEQDNDQLMGLEICGGDDEECLKRRMLSEAHLDYIYTQNHKP